MTDKKNPYGNLTKEEFEKLQATPARDRDQYLKRIGKHPDKKTSTKGKRKW